MTAQAQIRGDELTEAILSIREQTRAAGDAARATFVAETRLVEGFRTEAHVRQFTFGIDEPAALGGTDTAPNPVEMVLAALGTCQEIVYATHARILGIPLDSVSVRVSGELDPRGFLGVADVPAGFRSVQFDVEISSAAPADDVARLVREVNARCPVLDILERPLPVTGRYALNGAEVTTPA